MERVVITDKSEGIAYYVSENGNKFAVPNGEQNNKLPTKIKTNIMKKEFGNTPEQQEKEQGSIIMPLLWLCGVAYAVYVLVTL
jgi:predicted P-loop ATPase/GTPase